MLAIDFFIETLANTALEKEDTVVNLYHSDHLDSRVRRWNLKLYFNSMKVVNPNILLLGEAPGYKGCRLTGIPFTSESIVATHPFFRTQKYRFINQADKLRSETSASIVWNELSQCKNKPLLWNIFPFHPHESTSTESNRTPTKAELQVGQVLLLQLLKLLQIELIIAVGKKAESGLEELVLSSVYCVA